jgi:hypothetical protein
MGAVVEECGKPGFRLRDRVWSDNAHHVEAVRTRGLADQVLELDGIGQKSRSA